jgi:toxin ParE1/3/4
MAQIIWTEPALSDLNDIAEYVALDNITAATQLVKKVFSSTEQIAQFPKSGRQPPELNESRYLEIIVGPCRIFYRIDQQTIYILYVMRSERELRKYLLDERANSTP